MASSTYSVVILGGSFGGLTAAHHLLGKVFPSLSSTKKDYKVILVTNSSKFFHKISAPRALINPQLQALDVGLRDIAPGFAKYGDNFELLLGYASQVDASTQTISYDGTEGNASGSVKYDSLIIATGADFDDPVWGVTKGWEKLEAAYKELHARLESAKTILIAGGGPAGVETAGEIVTRFPNSKDVTLLSGTTRLLAQIHNTAFGRDAESKLTRKGVKVVHNVKATSWSKQADGTTVVDLENGEKRTVDIFLPSTGNKINSGFVPTGWLADDQTKQIKTDPKTLRLDVPEVKNVYIFGTVGSYSDGGIVDVIMAYKALGESFRVDQLESSGGESYRQISPVLAQKLRCILSQRK